MDERYHEGSRELQDRFDTRRLADRIDERTSHDHIRPEDRAFIERMDMFFLATSDLGGQPQCSYKGGAPGFVRVLDEHTLAFPNYDGNGMFLSMGNVLEGRSVGLLFIDFEQQRRMRVDGIHPEHWVDPRALDIADIEYWICKKVFPAGVMQPMDVSKIKNFDKIVPLFTQGKYPDGRDVSRQGTLPFEVQYAVAADAADDGLQANERDVVKDAAREKAAEERPDPLLLETAAILADATALLVRDQKLAAQVLTETGRATHWAE